jgi:uncharacterized phage-associated protein
MAHATEVARYLAYIAANEEEPDYLTNLRLQKLLYYVQVWSLVMRGKPMFPEKIQAWVHGPVVKQVYREFASKGNLPIMPEDLGELRFNISSQDRKFVASVWDSYKGYSASKLREMTHQEDPWKNARKGYGPADKCEKEITRAAIMEYFGESPSE